MPAVTYRARPPCVLQLLSMARPPKRSRGRPPNNPLRPTVTNIEIGFAEVDDPYDPGKPLAVAKNVRANGLEWVYARGKLKDRPGSKHDLSDMPRKAAADRYQAIWERAQAHAQAIDYSRVKVDVSHNPAGLTEEVTEAIQELRACRVALGQYEPLLTRLCQPGGSIRDLDMRYTSEVCEWLRRACDRLIELWGVAEGVKKRR